MAKMTKKRAGEIAATIKEKFDPNKKTGNGKYTAYVRESVDDLDGIIVKWKEGKTPVFEVKRYQAIDINELSKEDLQRALDNYEAMELIAQELD